MHTQWLTFKAIKEAAVSKAAAGIADLKIDLGQYATEHGGTFLIYGSAARGDMRFGSDVDILVDFSPSAESAAWRFAEDPCYKLGLVSGVRPKSLVRTGSSAISAAGLWRFMVREPQNANAAVAAAIPSAPCQQTSASFDLT